MTLSQFPASLGSASDESKEHKMMNSKPGSDLDVLLLEIALSIVQFRFEDELNTR
jgi:hypothetical protein